MRFYSKKTVKNVEIYGNLRSRESIYNIKPCPFGQPHGISASFFANVVVVRNIG